ncbi:MAG: menaquinone biosynthesis decarboxylase [Omnitrophica bacterium RIFCSPLOWO2_12_FULL_44_17]|uniref:Menaquinone biosynthesis decarboxylase n=1 Tax=Candidatus Danuiimicrobium aquiferis TaxID=1801832 RepID=A0A1G1KQS6_9BACT|nr:MAG: menaquinone biosynthesis decarboxylase [Omnitrophica bacterium RIFCSPHIGHO2_02_FULL_45_28]OGW88415.1 MAG: menaquinone biosynthesis decarboxylase [Omnitrophica bacterium RIFCSPHIGHO2_12_FULL_44_12]OGW95273.1 MAG: menaquinone biosynthesis decarboxylase [Omnitrophica bacterium RIFCSPLOWO2_12_FULL_44_17]OGX01729.1 MAG: menaquinone biosynthesis decarboxylase [Omnitrophica bacterium RIFCSPLOWO2_02_FULL_44_11]
MRYQDLPSFIELLRSEGEIKEIRTEVDPVLEITEICDRVVKQEGPALFFHKVKGSSWPLVTNLFGSRKRINLLFGVSDVNDVALRIQQFLDMKPPQGILEKLMFLPKVRSLEALSARMVSSGESQAIIKQEGSMIDLLPVQKCWPEDGGRFITFPMVITHDPETGKRNVGLYRMHVYDNQTTGMHWQIHKDGAEHYRRLKQSTRLEVAVVLGADPLQLFSAACPLPYGVDELSLAGFLRGEPVKLVRCKTISLDVPANAQCILEGYVEKGEMRLEGPFGDHTGFYSRAKDFPVFHVTAMTHARNPVYLSTIVGRPPMEDCYIGQAIERIFLPIIQKQLPEIVDIHLPWEGCFHNCVIVSIRKSYPDQAKKVIHAIWGLGQMMFSKSVLVFDDDCRIQDLREVAWRAFNNIDPKRDMFFAEGPVDELDHSADHDFVGSKVGIDCTRKTEAEGMKRPWPKDVVMSDEIKKLVGERWREYGFN